MTVEMRFRRSNFISSFDATAARFRCRKMGRADHKRR